MVADFVGGTRLSATLGTYTGSEGSEVRGVVCFLLFVNVQQLAAMLALACD